jgi:hypothetical protein
MTLRPVSRLPRRYLLWLAAGFCLCQAVLAVAIDGWLDSVRDPEYSIKFNRLRARIAEAPERRLVLMLGSSRTAYGVDAREWSARAGPDGPLVFNFGLTGGGPLLQLVALRRLLDAGIRPDLVCGEVLLPLMVESEGRVLEEKMLDGARLRLGEVRRLLPDYHEPRRVLSTWAWGRLLPCYRHQAELRGLLRLGGPNAPGANYPKLIDGYGWRPRDMTEMTGADLARATETALSQYQDFCASTHLAAEPLRALEALLDLCRRERLPVELILLPEGKPFRDLYTAPSRASFAGLLAGLRQRWHVAVIDARDWVTDAGFWDTHHMTPDGARELTDRFGREVRWPEATRLRPAEHAGRLP